MRARGEERRFELCRDGPQKYTEPEIGGQNAADEGWGKSRGINSNRAMCMCSIFVLGQMKKIKKDKKCLFCSGTQTESDF